MKRFLVVFLSLCIFAGVLYAADSSSVAPRGFNAIPDRFAGTIPLIGKTPRTAPGICYVDNTVQSLQTIFEAAGGTYLGGADNTLTPLAAIVSCESAATRWAFEATPSTTVGHKIAADGSWQFSGPNALGLLKATAASASDNVSCQITLWY